MFRVEYVEDKYRVYYGNEPLVDEGNEYIEFAGWEEKAALLFIEEMNTSVILALLRSIV